ncbi:somatostatin receptor type 1-like [Triplophysa rosa]|uniref:somatostatin receptor type 1-like n=1 Tax=Triplophysa rosa TaxID=992332 RepID=UPI002545E15C|nr:somatostatin receptor type 1-like [Triplophysa rosa]
MNISTGTVASSEACPSANLTSQELLSWNLKTCFLCVHLLLGLPAHSYVLCLIVTGRGIALELYNFNLTVCEMIYCLHCLVYLLLLKFPCLTILQRVLQALVMTIRPLFQCLMCVERYLAVVHPVTFLKYKPFRYRVICSAAVWIISLASCLGRMVTFILLEPNVYVWAFSILFLLLLPIQLYCCVAVLRALKQSGPGERGRKREEENHMKKRAFYIILIANINMVIMFVPYIITGFLTVLAQQDIPICWFISLSCFILSSFVQPVLYLHRITVLSLTAHREEMNISSEISSTHISNSSHYPYSNGTAGKPFDMFRVVDIVCVVFGLPANFYVIWLIAIRTANGLVSEIYRLPITGRPLFQCLICVERYLAVVYPVTFLKFKPFRYKVMCTVGVWVATFASSGVMLYCCLAVLRALKQSGPGERAKE